MRKLTVYVVSVFCISSLFVGCGNATNTASGETPIAPKPTVQVEEMPEKPLIDGDNSEERPGAQMSPENETDSSYEALALEKDLYSKKDLNGVPDMSEAVKIQVKNNSTYTVDAAGVYLLNGSGSDFTIIVEADKKDKVHIVLDGVEVSNSDFPVIYVKKADKCFVTVKGTNELSVSGEFRQDGDKKREAVVFSKDDLTLNGSGSLKIQSSYGCGIIAKDDIRITGGNYEIDAEVDGIKSKKSVAVNDGNISISAKSDGIQAGTYMIIDGGEFDIDSREGVEATFVQINNGRINIKASDDGINASAKNLEYDSVVEVNGGELTIEAGPGDTDCIDSNGVIAVNGGTIELKGQSTFDYVRGAVYNAGTIIINGEVTDTIPHTQH